MSEERTFSGKTDIHKGVTVSSAEEPCDNIEEFTQKLEASLKKWQEEKLRGIWFKVAVNQVQWIPILAQHGFTIHHGFGDIVSLVRWLPRDEKSRIPHYAHNTIGAGAVVVNDKDELLVVQERYAERPFYKLPGGYVEPKEDIVEAAQREVLEETNIETEFISLITFRHSLYGAFGCSDIYFVVNLKPLNQDIIRQVQEVDDCKWMKIEEFLQHPQVHENNRLVIRKYLENRKDGVSMARLPVVHPITKKPQSIYVLKKSQL